jgi:hypothetical protein
MASNLAPTLLAEDRTLLTGLEGSAGRQGAVLVAISNALKKGRAAGAEGVGAAQDGPIEPAQQHSHRLAAR